MGASQNLNNLHEQAGSKNVVHMHGELFKSRCDTYGRAQFDDTNLYEPPTEISRCEYGAEFVRISAGLARCRFAWIESMKH
jgi:NAD-dependent SIR2 family protein deacetylase